MPRAQIFEDKDLYVSFAIPLDSLELANAIRIFMISEVPTIAIDDVFIFENTSILYDETIAHRLGLIPLKSDTDILIPKDKWAPGEDVFSPNHSFRLKLECEVGEDEEPKEVYSKDLKPVDSESPLSKIIFPAFSDIPITVLVSGQKISLEAVATMSRGKEHAKWQPTAVATYKEYPHVTIKKCSACGKCVSACIRNILKIENGTCTVENEHLCALCDLCVESCPENAITVETYPGWYIFNIESVGQLTPKRIFIKALDELRSRYEEFNELLEKKLG